jgi:signal transduction histidine kinase
MMAQALLRPSSHRWRSGSPVVRGAAQGGAGLSLSIVDTLARRMGAQLVLFSPPDGRRNGLEARIVWQASLQ